MMRTFQEVEDELISVASTLSILREARYATFPEMQPGSGWECLYHAAIHQIAALAVELQDWYDIEQLMLEVRRRPEGGQTARVDRKGLIDG